MRVLARLLASTRRPWRTAAIVLLCAVAGLAQAQSSADDDRADPPGRVARLSYVAGDLGFLPAGAKDWVDASVNRPLTTGDRLTTGRDARAELELGGATLRMDGRSDFGLLALDDQLAQLELTQGTLNIAVRRLDQGQSYEIDTPTVALVIDQPGSFRVDVDDHGGGTRITAFDGGATVYGENSAQRTINPGRSYRFDDTRLDTVSISDIEGGDAFDAWARERDRRYAGSTTRRYVSDDVVGYQDLDQYGDWQDSREYGAVWYPSHVAGNWAPYRDGHWAYIAPWGWTWVDDTPWGYAPYHYGRWAYTHRGWGWIPGPRGVRPIYAPALVAFVGGGGWSIGIGGGPVGWFPLGPGEVYNPWYRASRNYYTNVNVTNIRITNVYNRNTLINNIDRHYHHYRDDQPMRGERYANREAPRGFTAVPGRSFAGGRHVQRDLVQVDPRKLADAPVQTRDAGRLRPIADGTRPSRDDRARGVPTARFDRQVVARHAPPRVAEDVRGPGRDSNLGAPRAGMAPSHVRVLDPRDRADGGNRPLPNNRIDSRRIGGEDARPPVRAATPLLPVVERIEPGTPAALRNDNRRPVREDAALPSARFAHPRGRDPADRPEPMPRPGVSYISGATENPPRPAYRSNPTLPPPVQFRPAAQQADPIRRPTPADDERQARPDSGRMMRREAMNAEPPGGPRFQRPEPMPTPRAFVREQPRPMPSPTRSEPMPQRFQPAQPSAPPARAETPRPQRSEPRPPGRKQVREDPLQH